MTEPSDFTIPEATLTNYVITGIQEGRGPLPDQKPLRQEINAWATNPENVDQVNLFLLALARFQAIPYDEKLSYFQIAGIHGLPFKPWDEKTESQSPETRNGYCTHNSILFPTWHRPYLLLYEQRLYEIMVKDIIPTLPGDRDKLIAQAQQWRLPYWDWAVKNADVPDIVRSPNIQVLTSTGPTVIPNPLHAFRAPGAMGDYNIEAVKIDTGHNTFLLPFDIAKQTSRYPPYWPPEPEKPKASTVTAWTEGIRLDDNITDALRGADWYNNPKPDPDDPKPPKYPNDISEVVYRLFTEKYFSTYSHFASTNYEKNEQKQKRLADFLSLEAIHNNLHLWLGGGGPRDKSESGPGHMSIVPVAAFDPIFWLHHNNIDRLFAIWQTLNPTAWFSDSSEQLEDPEGNWSTAPHTIPTPKSALAPFHDGQGSYFDSDKVRDWLKYGYSYPELQPWRFYVNGVFDEQEYRKHVLEEVKILYGGHIVETFTSAFGGEKHEDYIVNVEYPRFALNGEPFVIHIFIGKSKVGQVSNFSSPLASTACPNCEVQQHNRVLSTGQVPISHALFHQLTDGGTKSWAAGPGGRLNFGKDVIKRHLRPDLYGGSPHTDRPKEGLHWKVTNLYGEEISREIIPSVKVSLAQGMAQHFRGKGVISSYGEYTLWDEITEGL
ncbi:Di-copper centre-containing protein [Sistotremastrum suecicum HHB10207 ss-3]|uniref:tyrosinase n=1 Tax=Sistotremastrum suecicum HHB10207 ss-3 TaxID=1314776 RepID=A0A165YMC5_9AGAM|nr:Di-copper centre-containing protein [Sistotremastrum suecicum HHB10207 ss-3]